VVLALYLALLKRLGCPYKPDNEGQTSRDRRRAARPSR
jgi:hypothetical protein